MNCWYLCRCETSNCSNWSWNSPRRDPSLEFCPQFETQAYKTWSAVFSPVILHEPALPVVLQGRLHIYSHLETQHSSSVVFKSEPFAVPEGIDTVNLDKMISDAKILVTYTLPVEAFATQIKNRDRWKSSFTILLIIPFQSLLDFTWVQRTKTLPCLHSIRENVLIYWYSHSEFILIALSAPKENVDCLVTLWSTLQMLLKPICKWLIFWYLISSCLC